MDTNKILVVIPARGGSKGVPGKNIKLLGGKPLIQYTIEAARKIIPDDNIFVSTDSLKIKETVENLGLKVPFLRPAELATDTAGSNSVLLHALENYERYNPTPKIIILLQPTSPFRNAQHINEALELFNDSLDMMVSVKKTNSNPYYILKEENDEGFLESSKVGEFDRRQDCPDVWELNGAIYIINTASLKNYKIKDFKRVKKYVMDEKSSLDIDTPLDWALAEILVENN